MISQGVRDVNNLLPSCLCAFDLALRVVQTVQLGQGCLAFHADVQPNNHDHNM